MFTGNPLDAAPDTLQLAEDALRQRGLPITDEHVFLVASAIVPGKNMDLNEGIRFLNGTGKISVPLKSKVQIAAAPAPVAAPVPNPRPRVIGPVTTNCVVEENGHRRTFRITIDSPEYTVDDGKAAAPAAPAAHREVSVYSPFEGKVALVEVKVRVGEAVRKGQVVAGVEAMKAKHDVKAPCDGTVVAIHASIGTDVTADQPILTIGG